MTTSPSPDGLPPYLRPDCLPLAGNRALRAVLHGANAYQLSVEEEDGEVLMTALLPRDVAEELAERGRYATDGLRLEVTEERILVVCEDDIEGSFSLQAFQRLLHEADRRAA